MNLKYLRFTKKDAYRNRDILFNRKEEEWINKKFNDIIDSQKLSILFH